MVMKTSACRSHNASVEGIGISDGLGTDWNDDFLDTLASRQWNFTVHPERHEVAMFINNHVDIYQARLLSGCDYRSS